MSKELQIPEGNTVIVTFDRDDYNFMVRHCQDLGIAVPTFIEQCTVIKLVEIVKKATESQEKI